MVLWFKLQLIYQDKVILMMLRILLIFLNMMIWHTMMKVLEKIRAPQRSLI